MRKYGWLIGAIIAIVISGTLQWQVLNMNENGTIEVYVAKSSFKAGQTIGLNDCQSVRLKVEGFASLPSQSLYLGREALQKGLTLKSALAEGSLLTSSLSRRDDEVREAISMVFQLDDASAHHGEFSKGEAIGAVLSRQGQTQYLEGLSVESVITLGGDLNVNYLITVVGEPKRLSEMVLCQREGMIRLVKKIPAH